MNHFIIATHSKYAEGIYEGIKFFNSDVENISYINAYVENQEFEKEFLACVEKNKDKNLIVCTDMPGGSVNQVASRHINEYSYHLISGINLPLMLELVFSGEDLDESRISEIVSSAKEQLIYVNSYLDSLCNDNEL